MKIKIAERSVDDERLVLDFLKKNANERVEVIAKKCGFSRQKAWRIIKKLEERKAIWGYTIVTDEELQGTKHFILLVKRSSVPIDDAMKKIFIKGVLDSYLPELVKIEDIYVTHGMFGAVVTFSAFDLIYAKKLLQSLSSNIGKYFEEFVLLETLFPIRKQGLRNPQMEKLIDFL
ncbi:MAG: Lrp/AsnC family transcriptional regulator [Candidatus Thermoplasmatota archaeon]|nr:Lrp/AsnC family transcriptional regulator [Candidatus Thermoplasmatota archaeon]